MIEEATLPRKHLEMLDKKVNIILKGIDELPGNKSVSRDQKQKRK